MTMKDLLYGALLTALALLIPLAFQGWLQVAIPPFSATLASHLPTMLAMTVSPWVAILVGLGSSFGFFMTLGPIVAMRALTHAVFGGVGAKLYQKGFALWQILLITLPIHALSEAAVVMLFDFSLHQALLLVGLGTALHHTADSIITLSVYGSLRKAGVPLGLRAKGTVRNF
ncbi:MAG: ECF transporter S component [Bacillota bacterium]|nr:ECF transporter S component [Bacillota bacterium]HHT90836.1 ECF transporter S component [Bacillota bacterium]